MRTSLIATLGLLAAVSTASAQTSNTLRLTVDDAVKLSLDNNVDVGVYSPQSPLGSAIVGKKQGESATFTAPNGNEIKVEIVDVKPFTV